MPDLSGAIEVFTCPNCKRLLVRRTITEKRLIDRPTENVILIDVEENEDGSMAKAIWQCLCRKYVSIGI